MRERDVANLIGINTQRTITALSADKPWLRDLGLYTFNSYLRATINVGDLRTAYYLMNQYRIVGEWLLREQQEDKAIEVADYLREYGQLAHTMGLLLSVGECGVLCHAAWRSALTNWTSQRWIRC